MPDVAAHLVRHFVVNFASSSQVVLALRGSHVWADTKFFSGLEAPRAHPRRGQWESMVLSVFPVAPMLWPRFRAFQVLEWSWRAIGVGGGCSWNAPEGVLHCLGSMPAEQ